MLTIQNMTPLNTNASQPTLSEKILAENCANNSISTAREETLEYLDLPDSGKLDFSKLIKPLLQPVPQVLEGILQSQACEELVWNGSVLGEFTPDQAEGVRKGIRYTRYDSMLPLAFNSATLSPPKQSGALVAYAASLFMTDAAARGDLRSLEQLMYGVSKTLFDRLAQYYSVPTSSCEVQFDDNASMALFQTLGMLKLPPHTFSLTFFDTGRVIPDVLSGTNPEYMPFNFLPAIDIWENRQHVKAQHRDLQSIEYGLIEHYTDRYLSDQELESDFREQLEVTRPSVILIPTVTRLGRRVPFTDLCQIAQEYIDTEYNPIVLLDDCQGLGRMRKDHYLGSSSRQFKSIWDYCDGVIGTGAKVAGALMGSGYVLLNKERFQQRQLPFNQSLLNYRARQLAFMSDDSNRVFEHCVNAQRFVQSPELASFACVLPELDRNTSDYENIRELRKLIVAGLRVMGGVTVLDSLVEKTCRFEDSIISFYLTGQAQDGAALKRKLALPRDGIDPRLDQNPITLPALITADDKEFLRIALDPAKAAQDFQSYKASIEYVLKCIRNIVE